MADQTKLRKRLEALLKKPENQSCADCGKRGPRWASANLGTFFCIECSGIHRNLGVHISFVRSVNLDTWTAKQVEFMEEWGNARANAYYEAKLPRDYPKPRENDPVRVVEKFIREKYEQKRFIADSIPPPVTNGTVAEPEPVKEVRRTTASTPTTSVQRATPPAATQSVAPVKAAPAKEPDLLDFFDSPAPSTPAAPVAPVQQQNNFFSSAPVQSDPFFGGSPAPQQPQQQFQDPFFGGSSNPPPPPQQPQQQFQDPFFSTPQQAPQAAPAPPKASTDAILSLYSMAPSHQHHQGGMQPNSHSQGISMMMGPPAAQHPPMGMGMSMGMPRGMPHQPMGNYGAPAPQGFGGGAMGGMYPPQQPHYPGMMGGMPHQQYPPQQPHGMGMGGQQFPQNGYGMPQQNGMYPPQQRGW